MTLPQVYQRAIELGPEMELRIRQPSGTFERQRVREQLTLGRSAASDLVIDASGVNLIHARIVPGIGGQWELKCVGGSRLVLSDSSTVDRLLLAPGVTFSIGEKTIECAEVMALNPIPETFTAPHEELGPTEATAPIEMPRLVICPACFKDMTAIPTAARFCPKCGVQLPARNAAGFLIPPEESSPLYPVYTALRDELQAKLSDESPQVTSSMIILAYANAMLNLGWKYEHGRGLLRNVEEAARCYAKASKLSDAWGK